MSEFKPVEKAILDAEIAVTMSDAMTQNSEIKNEGDAKKNLTAIIAYAQTGVDVLAGAGAPAIAEYHKNTSTEKREVANTVLLGLRRISRNLFDGVIESGNPITSPLFAQHKKVVERTYGKLRFATQLEALTIAEKDYRKNMPDMKMLAARHPEIGILHLLTSFDLLMLQIKIAAIQSKGEL